MNAMTPGLDARRAKAAEAFRALGVPHRRVEEWKYSDLRSLLDAEAITQIVGAQWSIEALPDGVELFNLSSAGKAPDWMRQRLGALGNAGAMDAASLAFARSGFALRVPRGGSGKVRVRFSGAGQARVLLVLEENAALTLIESADDFAGFQNIGAEILLAADARLTHVRLAPESTDAVRVAEIAASVARGALYRGHFADFGAKLSRTELHIALEGEGAQAHLSGVCVLGQGHADVTTHIGHAVGNTRSTQLFKNIAGGHSRAVYQGKVTVRPGANGSDSRQTAKGLLLGARAEIDLKPELEILADDVKCAHGAAIGDLDVESLFYLRSRGLPETEARALLMRAFLGEAIDDIENTELCAEVWRAVEDALTRAAEAPA
jgi:Fe-S cluster assembly protein SufD